MRFSEMNINEGTPNKVAALLILEILREYTDEDHTVTRQWIAEKLAKKDFTVDPKTIVRHLVALKNLGYPIEGLSGKMEDYKRLNTMQFSDLHVNAQTPKSMAIVLIYEILREYSDEEHSLSRKKIIEILAQKGFSMDKKAVGHYLEELLLLGVDVEGLDIDMIGSTKKQGNVYIEPNFNKTELQLLMDSVLFSKHISSAQAKLLIEKIGTLGNGYFKDDNIALQRVDTVFHTPQKTYLYDMQLVQQAIAADKDISFVCGEYSSDKTLKTKSNNEYLVSPYYLVVSDEHYYLIGYNKDKGSIAHYRLDKMRDLKMKKTQRVDIHNTSLKGIKIGDYLKSHPNMYVGDPERVTIQFKKAHIDYVLHTFGDNFSLEKETDTHYVLKLQVNEDDMFYWALQYGTIVEVLEPQPLRDRIRIAVEEMAMRYLQNDGDRFGIAIEKAERLGDLKMEGIDLSKERRHQQLKNIRSAYFADNNLQDFSFVANYERTLKRLHIRNNPLTELSFLEKIPRLEYLELYNLPIKDLTTLKVLPRLKELVIMNCDIVDYSVLAELAHLQVLVVENGALNEELEIELVKACPNLSIRKWEREQGAPQVGYRDIKGGKYPYCVLRTALGYTQRWIGDEQDIRREVEKILDRLPKQERELAYLLYKEGLTSAQASERLGISKEEERRLRLAYTQKLSHKSFNSSLRRFAEPEDPDRNYSLKDKRMS